MVQELQNKVQQLTNEKSDMFNKQGGLKRKDSLLDLS